MHLIVDWILLAGMPLILVTTKGKRKPVKKKIKRSAAVARARVKRSRVKRKVRVSKRPTPRVLPVKRSRVKRKVRPSKHLTPRVLPAKRSRVKRKVRPSKRPTPRALRGNQVTTRSRAPAQIPAVPVVAPKSVETEPPPKPVPPIGRAILLSPENEKFVDSFHPTFRWLSVGGATRYEIAWSEDPAFHVSHAIYSIATEAAVPVEKPLSLGKMYYWRIRGGNESGWGPWSPVASFRVLEETG